MRLNTEVKVGDEVTPDWVPTNAQAPFTVSFIGHQVEGPYFEGFYANGVWGIVFPEDL